MLLTLLAFLDVLGDILVHLWPPKSLGHCSVGQRTSSNMNIAYPPYGAWSRAPQPCSGANTVDMAPQKTFGTTYGLLITNTVQPSALCLPFFPSAGNRSSAKKSMIGFIQHGSDIVTIEAFIFSSILGSATTSTLISRGTSLVSDDGNVAKELAYQFCPLLFEPPLLSETGS